MYFQYSIIPPFHYSIGSLRYTPPRWGEIKAGSSGPGSLLFLAAKISMTADRLD
ncbi:hypothetical protein D1AOALGA4SA_7627 [Olavius algarvensis Delta 1 endosymbiont]|nr:hypothetical protein D1AOALGA4SA_7627 [Olavius algarvensis Delta 1 endosymbiont]